ncbi:MAG: hypothetical protein ABGZ17_07265 [Planctomycetaceae bacterium]
MVEQDLHDAPCAAADAKAFEILVRRHHRRLLGYAISIVDDENTARDVVQDAFVVAHTVWRGLGHWAQPLAKAEKGKGWGAGELHNTYVKQLGKAAKAKVSKAAAKAVATKPKKVAKDAPRKKG